MVLSLQYIPSPYRSSRVVVLRSSKVFFVAGPYFLVPL